MCSSLCFRDFRAGCMRSRCVKGCGDICPAVSSHLRSLRALAFACTSVLQYCKASLEGSSSMMFLCYTVCERQLLMQLTPIHCDAVTLIFAVAHVYQLVVQT